MKRTLALAVACALVLEGCGESDAPGEARKKTVLEYASMKDIRNINPHLYLGEMAAQAMVFEPLVFNTPEGVKPALAERWEISGDGRTYTFHLRRGVKFTDGTPFTADAVKKNIDAVMANRTRHAWLDMINEIESSEVVDEHTWRLHLRHPYFPALIELGLSRPFRFISPACMKDGVTCLAGTGPWVLSEHKDQQYALFSRNEGYWGDKPIVPTVRWNVVPDTQTMLMALEKGEIDLVFGADGDQLTGDAFKKLTDEKRLNTAVSEPIASRAILVNSKRPITKDVRVREALAYAFNRQAVVDGIRTKDGARLVLDFYFNSNNAQEKTIAEAMQGDLLKIGVELRVIGEEKQAFLDRQRTGEFDLQYSLSWGAPYDPQSYLSSWRIPAHGDYQSQIGLADKAHIDATITALMTEADETKRAAMVRDVLTRITDAAVYIPVSYSRTKAVYSNRIKDVSFAVTQYEIPFEKMSFTEAGK